MLENLNQLAQEAKQKSDNYDKNEFVFSDKFKSTFRKLLPNYNIKFYNYTSVVTTSTNLLIIVPNQWFVIASFFNNYISALKTYKNKVNELGISKETIKQIREDEIIDHGTEAKITAAISENNDLSRFNQFLTDYDWWYGSKTIDRGDYFVSAILNLASVIHNSQSYIADLAYSLSEHQDLVKILEDDYNSLRSNSINETYTTILENKILRTIIFDSFKFILNKYGEDKVLMNHEIKDTKIEDRKYKGFSLNSYFGFETLLGLFDKEQTIDGLKSSGTPRFIEEKIKVLGNENSYFTTQWNGADNGRGLSLENFNRLLSHVSNNKLKIVKKDSIYELLEKSSLNEISSLTKPENIIYYGSPGTGKSYKVEQTLKDLDQKYYERITFHPEFDNSSFVGGYRPVSERINHKDEDNKDFIENVVNYKFVPQAFTNIYERAWNDRRNQYYLAIEEINRGNCAEIFGDIFQLLDRNSNYTVSPSNELRHYLESKLGKNHDGIKNGLKLPTNLSLLATMNTSDQSLFPMDSAFKRRWDWEYIPICYDKNEANKSSNYFVKIDETNSFNWIEFIKAVNQKIKGNRNLGPDKCIGNYFIKPEENEISLKEFVNKAVFYLWNDVFKDEDQADSIFKEGMHYEDFFPIETKGKELILEILKTNDFKGVLKPETE
ncbi:hypothetical protein H4V97_002000 [Flavobacterium sp. CG_23.5]|uniref:McrB family protein n=1 Tax=Flavobacterium sp. CG_23.5 TaxID=2760708 RepID=UPI001AE9AED2|nr:AAA family ATPase [Flavobacterium sp. CG_23.5]MBP2283682.1 hypothetical protein [Flavobacterium sp. CG_23.5]